MKIKHPSQPRALRCDKLSAPLEVHRPAATLYLMAVRAQPGPRSLVVRRAGGPLVVPAIDLAIRPNPCPEKKRPPGLVGASAVFLHPLQSTASFLIPP